MPSSASALTTSTEFIRLASSRHRPLLGTAAQAYRSEIGRRTRRGLEGRAMQAMPTGGKAYGYRTVDGRRVVDPGQAAIVREIFERYGNEESPRHCDRPECARCTLPRLRLEPLDPPAWRVGSVCNCR